MKEEFQYEPEDFDDEQIDDVYGLIYDLQLEGFTYEQIFEHVPPAIQAVITRMQQAGYLGGQR